MQVGELIPAFIKTTSTTYAKPHPTGTTHSRGAGSPQPQAHEAGGAGRPGERAAACRPSHWCVAAETGGLAAALRMLMHLATPGVDA